MKKLPTRSARRDPGGQNTDGAITDVPGIRVGHAHDRRGRTGCTVVLCNGEGAVTGVDVRGAAPGTRETDLLAPGNLVERAHAVVLTGGSVFGLDSACGVVRFLEERDIGFATASARVPIVPAAVIFDLGVGSALARPDAAMGYRACEQARGGRVEEGRVGAGAGATVGKLAGPLLASPGGIGTASRSLPEGATIGALVVVNAFGDVVDPRTGRIIAGARLAERRGWLDSSRAIREGALARAVNAAIENTTLAVVATDAALTKAQAQKVAAMAHDGFARAIRPAHTMFDGDTIFALSTGQRPVDVTSVGAVAAELVALAIVRAVRASRIASK
jgi:L-aminopeptidase/D-esterase-like protein